MKLGLRYIEVGEGTNDNFPIINSGQWSKNSNFPHELSPVLSSIGIAIDDTTSKMIAFKFIEDGLLICISKRLETRGDSSRSNEALWIFIPSNIEIEDKDFNEIIFSVSNLLDNKTAFINEDLFIDSIPSIFNKEFAEKQHASITYKMEGKQYAFIEPENNNFGTILNYGFQDIYRNYGLILFSDPKIQTKISLPKIEYSSLRKRIWIKWPEKFPSIISSINDFQIKINNKSLRQEGGWIYPGIYEVTLYSKDFLPVTKNVKIPFSPSEQYLTLDSQWENVPLYKKLDFSLIKILDEEGNDISYKCNFNSTKVRFNGKGTLGETFHYSDDVYYDISASEILINVKCSGYEDSYFFYDSKTSKVFEKILHISRRIISEKINNCNVQVQLSGENIKGLLKNGFIVKENSIKVLSEENKQQSILSKRGHEIEEKYDIILQDKQKGKISFNRFNSNFGEKSPIKGYTVNENGVLEFNKKIKWPSYILSCFIGIFICLLFIFLFIGLWNNYKIGKIEKFPYYWYFPSEYVQINNKENDKNNDFQKDEQKTEEPTKYNGIKEAILYLDRNDVWEKDSIIKYPDIKNLFDELNNFDFNALLRREEQLKGSNKFNELIAFVKINKDKVYTSPYTPTDDLTITISKYIDILNKKGKVKNEDRGGVVTEAAKEAQSKKNNSKDKKDNSQKKSRGGI